MTSTAVVLGGGGVTGIAWTLGLVHGLHAAGVDLDEADLVIGTSAGSVVGAQLRSGHDLDELLARQLSPVTAEASVDFDPEQAIATFASALDGATDADDICRRLGAVALTAPTVPEEERLGVIRAQLPESEWPRRPLQVTAIDTATGELVVWDRTSGVPLDLAVAASCAVPGVWPPVTVGGRRYMDGGVRSVTNAVLAKGHDLVVVLAPITYSMDTDLLPPDTEVLVVSPDQAAVEAIGPNPLDAGRRPDAARAGVAQAGSVVEAVRAVWRS